MDIALASATDQARAIAARHVSSRELLESFVRRMERINPEVNAIVTLDLDRAFERARALDDRLTRDDPTGPLHGLPITVKDSFETAGLRTTAGATALENHVPERDADAVARAKAAGAIVFGKTNVPPWGDDHQTYNDLFGTTKNPWDLQRSPGGSSGGAAVAVATGMTSFEIGSDIANSIRAPASHCGVYGHKPTHGFVSYRGHIPPQPGAVAEPDLTVAGPLARAPEDLGLLLETMSQHRLERPVDRALTQFRIGAWFDDDTFPVAPDVHVVLDDVVAKLRAAGAAVDDERRPDFSMRHARSVFNALLVAATSDIRTEAELEFARAHRRDDDPIGTWARNVTMTHLEWLGYNEQRARLAQAWADYFARTDVLLTPVVALPAIHHDQPEERTLTRTIEHRGAHYRYFDQSVWAGLTGVALLPSTVAPAGRTDEGLPVGVQITGAYGQDLTTIAFARKLVDVAGGYESPPIALF